MEIGMKTIKQNKKKTTRAAGFWQSAARVGQKGMTLVEVLVVLTIMASIMGMVGFFVAGALDNAAIKEAQSEIKTLSNAVDTYSTLNQRKFPDTLEQLTQGPAPLIKKIPKDPWGNEYIYNKTGPRAFEIISAGIDGKDGTEDDVKGAE